MTSGIVGATIRTLKRNPSRGECSKERIHWHEDFVLCQLHDDADDLIGCSFILPAGFIYKYKKTRVGAIVGMLTGTVAMAAIGVVLNTFVLVPLYSSFMPLTEIIKMGQAIFPAIDGTFTFCLYCVGPFNIIKGLIISVVVFIIYKPLSRLINSLDALLTKKKKATVQ